MKERGAKQKTSVFRVLGGLSAAVTVHLELADVSA